MPVQEEGTGKLPVLPVAFPTPLFRPAAQTRSARRKEARRLPGGASPRRHPFFPRPGHRERVWSAFSGRGHPSGKLHLPKPSVPPSSVPSVFRAAIPFVPAVPFVPVAAPPARQAQEENTKNTKGGTQRTQRHGPGGKRKMRGRRPPRKHGARGGRRHGGCREGLRSGGILPFPAPATGKAFGVCFQGVDTPPANSPSKTLRASFLRPLRVSRRGQGRKESGRVRPMCVWSLSRAGCEMV